MDNSELSIEARTALLGFIILKSEAIRALVSLVASKLNSIDADDDARKVRGKFFEIVSSKEYLELRSRCARLTRLSESHYALNFPFVRGFREYPEAIDRTMNYAMDELEGIADQKQSTEEIVPPVVV